MSLIDTNNIHTFILTWMADKKDQFKAHIEAMDLGADTITVKYEDREVLSLPFLPKLKKMPGVGSSRMVAILMTRTKEEMEKLEAEAVIYSTHLGLLAGLLHNDKELLEQFVGSTLDGTSARAEWDLSGFRHGLQRAAHSTIGETGKCLRALVEGYGIGLGLAELGATVFIDARKKATR